MIEATVPEDANVVGKVVDTEHPTAITESVVIPPDPECGNAIAESYESMCIDVEPFSLPVALISREVQIDLVNIISEMKCQRILAGIVVFLQLVFTLFFLLYQSYGFGFYCAGLFVIEVLTWVFTYYYSRKLMLTISSFQLHRRLNPTAASCYALDMLRSLFCSWCMRTKCL